MEDYVGKNQCILDEWRAMFINDKQTNKAYAGWSQKEISAQFAEDGIMFKGVFDEDHPVYYNGSIGFRWIRKQTNNGLVENQLWNAAPLRVLYLTKDQNTGDEKAWDVRSESFRYPDKRYKPQKMWLYTQNTFFRNLVYSLYGILNTKPNFKTEYNFTNQQALQCADDNIFARINCKKEVGYDRCLNNILEDAINNDRDFLKRQITLLDADIFVCCGYSKAIGESGNLMLNFLNTIGYNFKADKKESWIYYDEENNKIAINSYHLSYPGFDYEGMINAYFEFLTIHPEFINSHR